MAELNPQPLPPRDNHVRIYVSRNVDHDIDKMNRITATVLGKLGCPACHSGWSLDFVRMQDFVVNPKSLDVTEVAPSQNPGL